LIDSLDEDEEDAVDALWRAEVLRRADELDAGRVTAVDWDEVRKSLRR
jgi:putative addiction module component (TIGR02574 family)